MFFLIPSCRKVILELLIMVEQFFRIFRPVEGLNTHSKHLLYLKHLESKINAQRIVHAPMLLFWKSLCETLDTESIDDTVLEDLFAIGQIQLEKFGGLVPKVRNLYEQHLPKLFKESANSVYLDMSKHVLEATILTAFSQPTRFQCNSNIDGILKQNIRDTKRLLECSRCRLRTQTVMDLDEEIQADFQSMPPWLNAFQDQCFCGGRWIPK
jgi:hypothetical protein